MTEITSISPTAAVAADPASGPSAQFEQKVDAFLRFTFPPLPGKNLLDEIPGLFADLQLMEDLRSQLPCQVVVATDDFPPVATQFMPTGMQLQLLCDMFAQDTQMQHNRMDDTAEARAHVFAHTLRAHGFACKKIFVHGDLGMDLPTGTVLWNYRCAPLVYVKGPDGGVIVRVVDLTLHPGGPLSPLEWIKLFGRGARIAIEVTPASQMSPPSIAGWDISDFGDTRAQALALLHRS